MENVSKREYWPPGPTRTDVEECLSMHSRVLSEVYAAELVKEISPETRFLLSALGQLVAQQRTAVRLFHDYPGALAAQRVRDE